MNRLPIRLTRQRRNCDLNPGTSAPKSSTLTTRLQSHLFCTMRSANLPNAHVNTAELVGQSWSILYRPKGGGVTMGWLLHLVTGRPHWWYGPPTVLEFLVINFSVCFVLLSNCHIIIYCIVWLQDHVVLRIDHIHSYTTHRLLRHTLRYNITHSNKYHKQLRIMPPPPHVYAICG